MNKDEITSHLENLSEDCNLEITKRQLNKFVNLILELKDESDISYEEIFEELQSIAPSDEDEWNDFLSEVSDFTYDLVSEENENSFEDEEE